MSYKYINEVIRINYKCNWNCKFCNVIKVNNFGLNDITTKEVILKLLNLYRKYDYIKRKNIIISFSGGEPLLNKKLIYYISIVKNLGFRRIQIQTNGSILYLNNNILESLQEAGLSEVFLSYHSSNDLINKKLGCIFDNDKFISWFEFIKEKKINIRFILNIVITKVNINSLYETILFLEKIGFIKFLGNSISFAFLQPNGYAEINKRELLLEFNDLELFIIKKVISYCEKKSIFLDFHYTSPPLCILDYKKYNLEYNKLNELINDKINGSVDFGNLETFKFLWKEKLKLYNCKKCEHNKSCLGFYKNWVSYVGEDYVNDKINNYLSKGDLT